MTIITRFAPSPTGILHIGGARTALFNWLFARHHKGCFLLRIEDTDKERSTQEAKNAILDGLDFLDIQHDGDIYIQSSFIYRHQEVAKQLIKDGYAYYCYATNKKQSEAQDKKHNQSQHKSLWRDNVNSLTPPTGIKPVVRFKSSKDGQTTVNDLVLGNVVFDNTQMDDLVLLRSDGTPTYNLSVVVDDHDMGITHIIRGVDHLNNAARQQQIYKALKWTVPKVAHIPLIHGLDGAKMSKRHGATGVNEYSSSGYLSKALRNYLLRLGWSHGDDEIFTNEAMVELFDIDGIGKSSARFDKTKLDYINANAIKNMPESKLLEAFFLFIKKECTNHIFYKKLYADKQINKELEEKIKILLPSAKERSKTLLDILDNLDFLVYGEEEHVNITSDAKKLLEKDTTKNILYEIEKLFNKDKEPDASLDSDAWGTPKTLEMLVRQFCDSHQIKLKDVAQPLRAALTGRIVSLPIFAVMSALGRKDCLERIEKIK